MIESKGKIIDFKKAKADLDGIVTPAVLRKNMDRWIDDYGKVVDMVVVFTYPDPEAIDGNLLLSSIGYTDMSELRLMGILDWMKQIIEHEND